MSFRRAFPRPAPLGAAALLAGALLAGCGSSGATTTAPPTTRQGTSPAPQTSTSGSSLKAIGSPKYATPSSSEPVQSGIAQISYRDITVRPGPCA